MNNLISIYQSYQMGKTGNIFNYFNVILEKDAYSIEFYSRNLFKKFIVNIFFLFNIEIQ